MSNYKTKVKDEYFDNIDTQKKAYILGFLIADGAILYETKPSGHISKSVRFHNTIDDSEAIYCIKEEICPERNIQSYRTTSNRRKKEQFQLKWVSNYMVETLETKYNIKQRKTLDKDFILPEGVIPENLFRHFFRGFFDGDGHVDYNSVQLIFTAKPFMEQILNWFRNFDYRIQHIDGKTTDYFVVHIWLDSKKKEFFRHFLYDNAEVYLSRKKLIFDTEITYSSRNRTIEIVEHRAEKI